MRWHLLALLLAITTLPVAGQDGNRLRQQRNQLATASEPEKFTILCNLAWEYRSAQPDSSLLLAQQALTLGQKLNLKKTARAIGLMGIASNHKGNNVEAYEFFKRALAVAEEKNDSAEVAHGHNNLGRLFMEQNMMERPIHHFNRALEIFSSLGDSAGMAFTFQSLGNYYRVQQNFAKSEGHYKNALKIRLTLKSFHEAVSSAINLGKLNVPVNSALALYYFKKADSIALKSNDALLLAESNIQTASSYLTLQDLVQAEKKAQDGLILLQQHLGQTLLAEGFLTMGKIQLHKGDHIKGRYFLEQAVAASLYKKDIHFRMEAYFLLWQNSKSQLPSKEFEYYSSYMMLKDSVRSMEAMQREARLNFQLEIERKDAENNILRVKEERKTFIIVIQVLLLATVVGFAYNLFRNRRRILRINRQLDKKNQEFEKVNELLASKTLTLENHLTVLLDFSRNRSIAVGNLKHAAKDIVTITAKKLNISRVSIWVYNHEKQAIETIALYSLGTDSFLPSITLQYQDSPPYFDTLKRERIIVADNARNHAATQKFTDTYFVPHDIHSLLDATFSLDGHLKGVLCCEQQNAPRHWTMEDKLFVTSVADIISLAFRTAQRLEYERHIKQQNREIAQMNEVLEQRVHQRTLELEEQNKRLTEYAFINSHMLRGPVSRILGLIHLIQKDPIAKDLEFMEHLRKSSFELDDIVKKITIALNEGNQLSIEDLKRYNRGDDSMTATSGH